MFSRICSNKDPVSDLVEFLRLNSLLCKKGGGEIDEFSILMGGYWYSVLYFHHEEGKMGGLSSQQFMWGHVYSFLCGEIVGRASID